MGEEISAEKPDASTYALFHSRLEAETGVLKDWIAAGRLNNKQAVGGFEQEAWLVNRNFKPAPINEKFIAASHSDLISAELARFNIELNVEPLPLSGNALGRFHSELQAVWDNCVGTADTLDTNLIMIGILPTLESTDLVVGNMSTLNRYKALNEQVMIARRGRPMHIDIKGHEHLKSNHYDVMLESAATSFQIHRQIPADTAPRYVNAAIIASALTVAVGANSPYLFGKQLWEETRIPLFEQAVEVGGLGSAEHGPIRRVTFGGGYLKQDVFECFRENLEHYPILLPVKLDAEEKTLPYLRLHNGTIWRWNRPLLGFDDNGNPHIRIEHRVISAGPTIVDEIANAAFFYGLQEWMATLDTPLEHEIEHAQAKSNFYEGAR
ncbi:MAG: glutamate--cysteine ligase, partial [Gammaproteobacteria bacterium]